MRPPSVRALKPLDAAWLSALHGEAFETPWSEQSFRELLSAPSVQGWMVEGPGFILTQDDGRQGDILTFQVAQIVQGGGLGRLILAHAITHLRDKGVKSIYLEVSKDRIQAKKLYENQGFRLERYRKAYYKTRSGRLDAEVWALYF